MGSFAGSLLGVRLTVLKGHAWVQGVRGEVDLGSERLREGDGAAISDEHEVALRGRGSSEVLVFDLA